jgi:hypothetical protein
VARLAARPNGRHRLQDEYGLSDEQINDAARWWSAVSEYEQSA